jgi:N-methylhydantoinase A
MALDVDAAIGAIASIGEALGLSTLEAASGIVQITDAHMTDLLRRMTIEKGFHPTDFVLYTYGGAGGLHASSLARELGAARLVIPLAEVASVWSAFGVGTSDILHIYESTEITEMPAAAGLLNDRLAALEVRARDQLSADGVAEGAIVLRRFALLRYGLQVNELAVPLPLADLTDADVADAIDVFEALYEDRYGAGSGYRGAGFELVSLVVEATGRVPKPSLHASDAQQASLHAVASRPVYWPELRVSVDTPVYRQAPPVDEAILGPAVIELESTTIAVRPDDSCRSDAFGNILVEVASR